MLLIFVTPLCNRAAFAVVADFSSGLTGFTLQTNAGDFTPNPGGAPVVAIKNNNVGSTIATSDSVGSVNDFDIAASFAGSASMIGNDSFGVIFGFQDVNNYYIAHVFPGFFGSAFRLEKVVGGTFLSVFGGSSSNHNVGFTWSKGDDNTTVTPDALRITRTGNTFAAFVAASSAGGWQSFNVGTGDNTWTDTTFGAGLVGFGERFDSGSLDGIGTRFAMFGEGTGIDEVLLSTDVPLTDSVAIPIDIFKHL